MEETGDHSSQRTDEPGKTSSSVSQNSIKIEIEETHSGSNSTQENQDKPKQKVRKTTPKSTVSVLSTQAHTQIAQGRYKSALNTLLKIGGIRRNLPTIIENEVYRDFNKSTVASSAVEILVAW